jgi:L-lysine 6-transaminase
LDAGKLADLVAREEMAVAQIKKAFAGNKDDICAIIIEPIQSEGGDNHVRKEFMEQLRMLADENEALLIYDEIQTGVGLTGKFWCLEHFGEKARPDILAFGKKMQVCGILAGPRIDEIENNVFKVSSRINSTWGGSLVDMVRATRILEIIEEDALCNNAAQVGAYLQKQLTDIAENFPIIGHIRGKGLLTAFDFPDKTTRDNFMQQGLKNNVMFLGCGDHSIRFRPALIMDKTHIDEGLDVLQKICKTLV